jgi:hypothetical protein
VDFSKTVSHFSLKSFFTDFKFCVSFILFFLNFSFFPKSLFNVVSKFAFLLPNFLFAASFFKTVFSNACSFCSNNSLILDLSIHNK